MGAGSPRGLLAMGRRVALSGLGSAVIMVVSAGALFVTSAPAWISLALEPVSLLLTPGVVASLLFTKFHDYEEKAILEGAFVFYFVLLYGWFWLRDAAGAREVLGGKRSATGMTRYGTE